MNNKLSARLSAVVSHIRAGKITADIGTDHAYIPCYLALNGISKKIIASDIADGPLEKAAENIKQQGCGDNITLVKTNGLKGIEIYKPDDVIICGMGGELIASILEASEYVRSPGVNLILQPMTRAADLRAWLCDNGFHIFDEDIVKDGKLFEIICASYDGRRHEFNQTELLLGKCNIEKNCREFKLFAKEQLRRLEVMISGREKSGLDVSELKALHCDIIALTVQNNGVKSENA